MKKRDTVLALYGKVKLVRSWCAECETNALVVNGRLQCCGSLVKGKPTEQVRMSGTPELGNERWDRVVDRNKDRESIRAERMKQNGGSHTKWEWINLCRKYKFTCLACGERKTLTEDHVIPVSLGGSDNIDNIQPLCMSCNVKKHTKHIDYRPRFS
jgi:5-methylcytosine-specific restriction endonuclease McrA